MLYKVKLKNARKNVILSEGAYEFFSTNDYYKSIDFLKNLRMHSSGYAFFQKNYPLKNGGYRNLTIYLHKAVAEKYIKKPKSDKKLFVRLINGDPLDCREENLEWVTMGALRRNQRKHSNVTGYRGVVQVSKNKFRAVLYKDKKRYDLGLFSSAEDAAKAYNEKSKKLFGETESLNKF
ncbi:MAG: Pathogenesis-related transcriptional factor and ERF protein [Bacteroidetes bacterium]|nr:Pathogenesis-related transcriptional factor and ERF protein [Bacteroidota bacterium]